MNTVGDQESSEVIRGSGRILLVDDDPMIRRSAGEALKSLGYDVTASGDGVEALRSYQNAVKPFDLVILDLQMPHMNGEAAFEEFQRVAPDLPILIWTGHGGDIDVTKILGRGLVDFLHKPYRLSELSRAVRDAIHRRNEAVSGTDSPRNLE